MSQIDEDEKIIWDIIECFFRDNPNYLVKHQIEPYEEFFEKGFFNIIKENNPIVIMKNQDTNTKNYKYKAELYIGGKEGQGIYYGKPIIYNDTNPDNKVQFMYPNIARLNNMTYGFSIHMDVDINYTIIQDNGNIINHTTSINKIFFGRFPIMLQSKLCILNKLTPDTRFNMGECKNDYGGYFIVDGKEKVIVAQEKFANNMLYIRDKGNELYSHSADIRTVSEDASKPVRTLSVRIVAPSTTFQNGQIVINVPNVRRPVPLFILMRALGVISDKKIIKYCLLDLEENKDMIDLFRPSIHDALTIFTQESALQFIATFTKGKSIEHVMDILSNYFMPNIGSMNYNDKAYMLGYIVKRLLNVYTKIEKPTDRDSFKYKRVEVAGSLLYDIFKEFYTGQLKEIKRQIDEIYFYKEYKSEDKFVNNLIQNNTFDIFKKRILETGVRKAFKGSWGGQPHTQRPGIVQTLDRLSYNKYISQLRKINLHLDSSAKIVGPRLLNSTQWGIIDPLDTPDGGNIGVHKHLALAAHITSNCSYKYIYEWLENNGLIKLIECTPDFIYSNTKCFINGTFTGIVTNPHIIVNKFKLDRRNGNINPFTSIEWQISNKDIFIATDGGRPTRPIFYIDNNRMISYGKENIKQKILSNKYNWKELIMGYNSDSKELEDCSIDNKKINEKKSGIIEFIDTAESETILIANKNKNFTERENIKFTHVEIHPSLCLGVMGNQIIFPEHNQLPRNMFSCVQGRQAVSLYNSNFLNRMDKMGVVLNYGETPLVKSRYDYYINKEEHPYGLNTIVAIMSYNGYNVEDAVLVNEGSLKRGMFNTTYYTTYEDEEEIDGDNLESDKTSSFKSRIIFSNIENTLNVTNLKMGYDYSHLDENGLIKENTKLTDKTIVIGKVKSAPDNIFIDDSYGPKKGQLGYVDKSFLSENENGYRIAKVRIREQRLPNIGDKICSRAGQKGTVGLIIPEQDMPFTADGLKPDLIINPHALPSRMTIGQLVECLMGKACCLYGAWGDSTAFVNKGPVNEVFGNMLMKQGYSSTGNEIMYNGMTGEQLEANIFVGPTYYLRLKHMVKDKINFRARGPKTLLTRQTVHGRANDGGLRIGEMERDGLIGHGMAGFLEESMMIRGDEYFVAVCNNTGTIAIYNEERNLFLSPLADGPIKFVTNVNDTFNIMNVSKFGRTFSIIRIPYTFKLLMQELATMNIQMRIITDDNVSQIDNLNFPHIDINDFNLKHISNQIKTNLKNDNVEQIDFTEPKSRDDSQPEILNEIPSELEIEPYDEQFQEQQEQQEQPFGDSLQLKQEIQNELQETQQLPNLNADKPNITPIEIQLKTSDGEIKPIIQINTNPQENNPEIPQQPLQIPDNTEDDMFNKPLIKIDNTNDEKTNDTNKNNTKEREESKLGLKFLDKYEKESEKNNEDDEETNSTKKIIN
jgi:DNA-directed RNA polymerase II subunit RPB2